MTLETRKYMIIWKTGKPAIETLTRAQAVSIAKLRYVLEVTPIK